MVERIIFPFRGAELGGSHLAAFTLARALQRKSRIECAVLAPEGTLILEEAARLGLATMASGEAPTGRNDVFEDFRKAGERREVLARLQAEHGAIVHCNDINSLRAYGLPAKQLGMGLVYHHHALNRMWWPPHLVALRRADAVICVSEATLEAIRPYRRDAVKELNPFDIDITVNRAAAHEALRVENGWRKDALLVGFVGNFWERKRPVFFLEMAREMFRKEPRCRFVMFGRDGDYSMEDMREHAWRLGVGGVVSLPGFRQPVEDNIAALDLLVAPAPREPFGRTLVEAIILGTPVMATRGAGHSEIIGTWGGGELAGEKTEAAGMADLGVKMMAAADRYVLPAKRRVEIASQVSSAAHADRVMRIYERIGWSPLPAAPAPDTRRRHAA